jgi:hypothetical protein
MSKWITLVPAYGRDYETAEEVLSAWVAGKDFLIRDISMGRDNGRYTSCRDAEPRQLSDNPTPLAGYTFKIRHRQLQDIALIRWERGEWRIVGRVDENNL